MGRKIATFFNMLFDIILVVILAINLYNITMRTAYGIKMPKIFGFGSAVVMSGSMEPVFSPNDIIYIKECNDYNIGDIITYSEGHSLITHRIVDMGDGLYKTQGDANNVADTDLVPFEKIQGKVVFVVPKLGASLNFLRTPLGNLLLVALVALIVVFGNHIISRPSRLKRVKAAKEKINQQKSKKAEKPKKKTKAKKPTLDDMEKEVLELEVILNKKLENKKR